MTLAVARKNRLYSSTAAIEAADQLHGQVGEEGQPAAQRCHGETQTGEEVEECRGQDDALVGQRKRVGLAIQMMPAMPSPQTAAQTPPKPLQMRVRRFAVEVASQVSSNIGPISPRRMPSTPSRTSVAG